MGGWGLGGGVTELFFFTMNPNYKEIFLRWRGRGGGGGGRLKKVIFFKESKSKKKFFFGLGGGGGGG